MACGPKRNPSAHWLPPTTAKSSFSLVTEGGAVGLAEGSEG